jgi:hypothetical protein
MMLCERFNGFFRAIRRKGLTNGTSINPTDANGKTTSLLLHLCKCTFLSGQCVILDSDFCFLQIVNIHQQAVHTVLGIRKRRFWPSCIKGQEVIDQLKDKDVDVCNAPHGKLMTILFTIFALKEQKYVLMMRSTYGTLETYKKETQHTFIVNGKKTAIKFQYWRSL